MAAGQCDSAVVVANAGQMLAPAENSITNASRNFRGRFGSPEANIYVASSATVAASAIAGRIVSPAEFMSNWG